MISTFETSPITISSCVALAAVECWDVAATTVVVAAAVGLDVVSINVEAAGPTAAVVIVVVVAVALVVDVQITPDLFFINRVSTSLAAVRR